MKLLLDTHSFIWYVTADPKLPAAHLAAIRDEANEVFLSVVSVWEAVIKHQLNKLPLPGPPAVWLPEQRRLHNITTLNMGEETIPHLAALPPIHRDPFDRMLIAQTLQHGMTLVTVDGDVLAYPVPHLPAS